MSRQPAPPGERIEALSGERAKLLDMLLKQKASQSRTIKRFTRDDTSDKGALQASWAQQRLWFIDQLDGGGAAYNVRIVLRLRGRLDIDALRNALDGLVQRHEVLRTVFVNVEGVPRQVIRSVGKFDLKEIELRTCEGKNLDEEIQSHKLQESRTKFELSIGPLIRGRLLIVSPEEHVLLVTMHHIVSDGWSTSVFVREFSELYSSFQESRPATLEPLPIQYADYSQWQREPLQRAAVDEGLKYWLKRLDGAAPELSLPVDRPRPTVQRYRGANVAVLLDAELTSRLNALARRRGMTLYMVLCAGWSILLSRLGGQKDVVIGTPTANRRRPELEGLIGLFVNTLALRVDISSEMLVGDLLMQIKEVTLGAFEHQDVPFEQLVEALNPPRSLNRHPIFQVMFVLQNTPRSEFALPGLSVTQEDSTNETSKFDLLLSLDDRGNDISGLVNFDTDLFDSTTIERWVASFRVLLKALTEDEQRRIIDLPLLTELERRQVIASFNSTRVPFPNGLLIHQLFEEHTRNRPSAVAVTHHGHALTYAALDQRANKLAARLRESGIGPDRLVGICMERSLDMIVGLLAILKAGGAYLPLDPIYPRERLTYMIQDAAPPVILIQEHLRKLLPETHAETLSLDSGWETGRDDSDRTSTAPHVATDSLLYVIYTSGSTGRPKGVAMTHGAMANLIYWHRENLPCTHERRVLQFAALSFDVAFQEIFSTLCGGGTLILLDESVRRDPHALTDLLRTEGVQRAFMPPLMLQSLAEHFKSTGIAPNSLTSIIVAGEQLRISPEIVSFFKHLNGCRLHNHYGPTETHVVTSSTLCVNPEDWPSFPTIGRPIANTQVYILDAERQPMPIGASGEIYIAGANLAREYLHLRELTAERFVRNHFSRDLNARMYKTGDLGRWRADGTIEYLGRNDGQVKVRGFRIELGEIEEQLALCEYVKEVVVIAREDAPGEKRLVAYVCFHAQSNATVEDLRAQLRSRLPEHMLPSAYSILEALPRTPSGKLNRRALPAPDASAYARQEYEAPQGDVEERLAKIWADLLGVNRVGRHDDFFEIGGHSLLVLKALFKVNDALSCSLRVPDVYKSPTVSELARRIDEGGTRDEFIELAREATLGERLMALPGRPRMPEQAILLTGSTGFVGRFLLARLLQDTNAVLHCLVRGRSAEHASQRLRATMTKWGLWRDEWASRIVTVPGDLRQARLGIDPLAYEHLSQVVDSVYHCGTSMNHLETYAMAKAANVDAMKDLLSFATYERPKLINYISTLGIFAPSGDGRRRLVSEPSSIDDEKHLNSRGYTASKWVGEKLAMLANERGIPCNIFRLGFIWADSEQGRYDELQRGYRIIKSCLLSGLGIENYCHSLPPTPVDYTARAIVGLAARHGTGGGVFHISSSQPMTEGLFECCNRVAGRSLKLLPHYEWIGEMRRLHLAGHSLPIVPLIEYAFSMDEATFHEYMRSANTYVSFDCARTQQELNELGITAASLNDDWMRLCVNSMISRDEDLRELVELVKARRPRSTEVEGSYMPSSGREERFGK